MGVHFFITSTPKKASFASLHASAPAFDSPLKRAYLVVTLSTEASFSLLIAEEGRELELNFDENGSGLVVLAADYFGLLGVVELLGVDWEV